MVGKDKQQQNVPRQMLLSLSTSYLSRSLFLSETVCVSVCVNFDRHDVDNILAHV